MNFDDEVISVCKTSNRVKINSIEQANKIAKRLNRETGRRSATSKLFPYPCPNCYKYHLSTNVNSFRRKKSFKCY